MFASAGTGDFAGAGSAWFHLDKLLAFGQRLQTCYPLRSDADILIEGGYWNSGSSPPQLDDVLLSIRAYPVGSTGTIGLRVELADGQYEGQRTQSRARTSFELLAGYDELQVFGVQIAQLAQSPSNTASLFRRGDS